MLALLATLFAAAFALPPDVTVTFPPLVLRGCIFSASVVVSDCLHPKTSAPLVLVGKVGDVVLFNERVKPSPDPKSLISLEALPEEAGEVYFELSTEGAPTPITAFAVPAPPMIISYLAAVPPLVTLAIVLLKKQVLPALLVGAFSASLIIATPSVLSSQHAASGAVPISAATFESAHHTNGPSAPPPHHTSLRSVFEQALSAGRPPHMAVASAPSVDIASAANARHLDRNGDSSPSGAPGAMPLTGVLNTLLDLVRVCVILPAAAFTRLCNGYIIGALTDGVHMRIVGFVFALSGALGIAQRSGATVALAGAARASASTPSAADRVLVLFSFISAFDDYACIMIVGAAFRAVSGGVIRVAKTASSAASNLASKTAKLTRADKDRTSVRIDRRGRIAWLVQLFAPALSSMLPWSSWIGAEIGYVAGELSRLPGAAHAGDGGKPLSAFGIVVTSIPMRSVLISIVTIAITSVFAQRDFMSIRKLGAALAESQPDTEVAAAAAAAAAATAAGAGTTSGHFASTGASTHARRLSSAGRPATAGRVGSAGASASASRGLLSPLTSPQGPFDPNAIPQSPTPPVTGGALSAVGTHCAEADDHDALAAVVAGPLQPFADRPHRLSSLTAPFGVLALVVVCGLYETGRQAATTNGILDILSSADALTSLYLGGCAAVLTAVIVTTFGAAKHKCASSAGAGRVVSSDGGGLVSPSSAPTGSGAPTAVVPVRSGAGTYSAALPILSPGATTTGAVSGGGGTPPASTTAGGMSFGSKAVDGALLSSALLGSCVPVSHDYLSGDDEEAASDTSVPELQPVTSAFSGGSTRAGERVGLLETQSTAQGGKSKAQRKRKGKTARYGAVEEEEEAMDVVGGGAAACDAAGASAGPRAHLCAVECPDEYDARQPRRPLILRLPSAIWGAITGCGGVCSSLFPCCPGLPEPSLSLSEAVEAAVSSACAATDPIAVLICAWTLSAALADVQTAALMDSMLGGSVPPSLLPAVLGLVASATSYATGSALGTMGIVIPVALPLSWAAGHKDVGLLVAAVGAVLGGSVFGNLCSPISDDTVVTSSITAVPIAALADANTFPAVVALVVALLSDTIGGLIGLGPLAVGGTTITLSVLAAYSVTVPTDSPMDTRVPLMRWFDRKHAPADDSYDTYCD